PPHLLQVLDRSLLQEPPGLTAGEGETRVTPANAQVQIGVEGLAALGHSRQVREEDPDAHLDRSRARRAPPLAGPRAAARAQAPRDVAAPHPRPVWRGGGDEVDPGNAPPS